MPPRLSRALPALPLPSPQPSSYLAVGSWLVDLRVPGGRWRRRREKRRERFHPFRVWEEQMKSAVSAPEGKVPRAPRTDLALPSAQCHGATWNKAGLPLCGAKAEEGGTRTPRDLGDGGHSDTLWGFTMHHVAKFTGTLVTYTYQSSTLEAEAGGLP